MLDPKVYSYMRFSDPRQGSGTSSDRQIAYAAGWAREHGVPLDTTLTLRDEGLSAYHQRHVTHGALGVFLAAVEAGKVAKGSFLIVEGLDRLSRAEPIQAQAQLAQIINAGITVVTAADGKTYSRETLKKQPMDLVYSLLVQIRAHEESDTKSRRVVAAIRQRCTAWQAGTWRGLLVNGKDPLWCAHDGAQWNLVPERVAAVHFALDLFRKGQGAVRIVRQMHEQGLTLTDRGPSSLQVYRLVRQRALMGVKELAVGGETFLLQDYYPPLLTEAEWNDLQVLADDRGRRRVKGDLPHVLTGLGITICGYCGRAMAGQNLATKQRLPDGRIRDSYRRLLCTSSTTGKQCDVPGSMSEAPVERALMAHCSDLMNLQALYGADRTVGPRVELQQVQQRLAEVNTGLDRLTDALVAMGGLSETFVKRVRALEDEKSDLLASVQRLEREIAIGSQTDITGIDEKWKALTHGVEQQDYDIRLQARQLVADTFHRIAIYHRGVRPKTTPKGVTDVVLLAKGGISRLLRIDSKTGQQLSVEDFDTTAL